jgi:uncharacterized protein YhfF
VSRFKPVKTNATDDFFSAFKADAKVEADTYTVVGFGDSERMADDLLELVLAGIKRATTTLARTFADDGEALPKAGEYAVIVDGRNKPRCVMQTTEMVVKPLTAVDDAFAFDEGEGDRTRETWLRDHRDYFSREAEEEGFAFSDDIETAFERFVVVWPRLFADDWKGPRLQ